MPNPPSKKIHELIVQGETGAALSELTAWAQSQQQYDWIKQCILLQARWEQLQRDIIGGILDADDMRQENNQINAAILNLLEWTPAPSPTASVGVAKRRPGRLWLALAGIALMAALAFWQWHTKTNNAPDDGAAIADVRQNTRFSWPDGQKTSIAYGVGQTATYEIRSANLEPYDAQNDKLRLEIRCSVASPYPVNFWDDSFRLLAGGQPPIAPQSGLNAVVEGNSFKDGEIWFVVPKSMRSGRLAVSIAGKATSLAMAW